jgi:hypothetical protein
MAKKILENESPEQKKEYLKSGADKIEKLSYMKRFTNDEIVEFKNQLSDLSIEKDGIDTEFDSIKEVFKGRLKPIKEGIKTTLTYIRDKARLVTEDCYVVYDYENFVTEYYSDDGVVVYSRPMEPAERQKTIFSINKTGTDN